jgi:hypothetical protein
VEVDCEERIVRFAYSPHAISPLSQHHKVYFNYIILTHSWRDDDKFTFLIIRSIPPVTYRARAADYNNWLTTVIGILLILGLLGLLVWLYTSGINSNNGFRLVRKAENGNSRTCSLAMK